MLCRFPEGIRECVGLLVGEASVDEATGNRVSIEHKGMLLRSADAAVATADHHSAAPRALLSLLGCSDRPWMLRVVRWNPSQDVGYGGGNRRVWMT